ncbi:hypothetical protein C7M84_009294 [Penaeus vannamei]|uniref:Uncharacterized protein n=1 Tax=Penaeus vannamei TaxID=6689 RepID=A0A3R7M588_PENVA|nr:hypothetical protein C7M84_009294 [Penaeus vannamei]
MWNGERKLASAFAKSIKGSNLRCQNTAEIQTSPARLFCKMTAPAKSEVRNGNLSLNLVVGRCCLGELAFRGLGSSFAAVLMGIRTPLSSSLHRSPVSCLKSLCSSSRTLSVLSYLSLSSISSPLSVNQSRRCSSTSNLVSLSLFAQSSVVIFVPPLCALRLRSFSHHSSLSSSRLSSDSLIRLIFTSSEESSFQLLFLIAISSLILPADLVNLSIASSSWVLSGSLLSSPSLTHRRISHLTTFRLTPSLFTSHPCLHSPLSLSSLPVLSLICLSNVLLSTLSNIVSSVSLPSRDIRATTPSLFSGQALSAPLSLFSLSLILSSRVSSLSLSSLCLPVCSPPFSLSLLSMVFHLDKSALPASETRQRRAHEGAGMANTISSSSQSCCLANPVRR